MPPTPAVAGASREGPAKATADCLPGQAGGQATGQAVRDLLAASEADAAAGDFEAALRSAEAAREAAAVAGDAGGEALAALAAARAHAARSKPDEALVAAAAVRRLGRIALEGLELKRLEMNALQVLSQAHIAKAEACMQSSAWQAGGPDLGMVKSSAGESAKMAMEALHLSREIKDEPAQAFAMYLAAHAYFLAQQSSEACRFALQAHSLFRALKDMRMAGAASLTLAQAHYSQDRRDQALLAAKEALSLSTTARDPEGVDGARQLLEQVVRSDGEPATVTPCRRL